MSFLDRLLGRSGHPVGTAPATRTPLASVNSRLIRDRRMAQTCMPKNTKERKIGDATYWVYTFTCELGRSYTLACYFDGKEYQVKVLEPEMDAKYSVHDCHIFPSGRICLNPPANGATTLQEAYAKSVVWANGFSVFKEVGKFPFSENNE